MSEPRLNPRIAFGEVYRKAKLMGLSGKHMVHLESLEFLKIREKSSIGWFSTFLITLCAVIIGFLVRDWSSTAHLFVSTLAYIRGFDLNEELCLIDLQCDFLTDVFRPPQDCSICQGMTAIEKLSGIASEDFESKYAYSKKPVVITDGAMNWSATHVFNFGYFKNIYSVGSIALESAKKKCQFFPYKTNFSTLEDVFMMSEDRALMRPGAKPWYIGWSNCDPIAAAELRRHYQRPYFLPKVAESSKTDWIFMGSSGYGAPMHIDNVKLPSWQAQITGQKLWTLKPPLECTYHCPSLLQVTVNPGEIIVLDTNTWYHSTLIVGKDMSITIGSEFD